MTSEEVSERYKSMSVTKRAVIVALLGLIYPAYIYYERGLNLTEQLEDSQRKKESLEKQYQVAKKKNTELPLLEEKFNLVTEELRQAQEKLPNNFFMDDILHSIATVAKEVGVKMSSFTPQKEITKKGAHTYVELPISVRLVGQYNQIAGFFDRVVNLEKIVHLRNISMSAQREGERQVVKHITTSVDLIVFRSVW